MSHEGASSAPSDRALVLAFQTGDEDAYDEIYRRYYSRVSGVCARMLRTPQDAEEAAQETFLKAYQALGRFNGSFYLGAWLSRIASNVCVDQIRSRSRTNLVALPDDQDDLITERGPEDIVIGEHPRLDVAIRGIQPLHASALALRALEGLSHQEIADRLAMTPSQVKALLHRARGSLRRAWDKAEGWALAPLFGWRFFVNDRATGDVSRLASMSPSATPFLIERVATSAMIVAAALSGGLPSAPDTVEEPPAVIAHGPSVDNPVEFPAAPAQEQQPVLAAPRAEAPEPQEQAAEAPVEEPDLVTDLTQQIEKSLRQEQERAEPSESRNEEGQRSPVGRPPGPVKKVVHEAQQTAEKAVADLPE